MLLPTSGRGRGRILHRHSASVPINLSPLSFPSQALVTQETGESTTPPIGYTPSDSEGSDEESGDNGIAWGHPLQRMVNTRPIPHDTTFHLANFASSTFPAPEINFQSAPNPSLTQHTHFLSFDDGYSSDDEEDEAEVDYPVDLSEDESDTSSLDWDSLDFEEIIDELMNHPSFESGERNKEATTYDWPLPPSPGSPDTDRQPHLPPNLPSSDKPHLLKYSLQILCLPVDSPTLYLLLHFNQTEIRNDPWNILPRVVGVAERSVRLSSQIQQEPEKDSDTCRNVVFLMLPRLSAFNSPPLQTVANWVDFLRQGLEGLTFLHEKDVVRLPVMTSPETLPFVVDLGAVQGPSYDFDRTRYPVKYYCTNFSTCLCPGIACLMPESGGKGNKEVIDDALLAKEKAGDVVRWGEMIKLVIQDNPPLDKKLAPLVQSMSSGDFTAEHARKLFEALCWGLHT